MFPLTKIYFKKSDVHEIFWLKPSFNHWYGLTSLALHVPKNEYMIARS